MINRKLTKIISLMAISLYGTVSYSYIIRNMHSSPLICSQVKKPHTSYTIASKASSPEFKAEGKYACQTDDKKYTSLCAVSEFQPIATFSTVDGSAGCSTPVKNKNRK